MTKPRERSSVERCKSDIPERAALEEAGIGRGAEVADVVVLLSVVLSVVLLVVLLAVVVVAVVVAVVAAVGVVGLSGSAEVVLEVVEALEGIEEVVGKGETVTAVMVARGGFVGAGETKG